MVHTFDGAAFDGAAFDGTAIDGVTWSSDRRGSARRNMMYFSSIIFGVCDADMCVCSSIRSEGVIWLCVRTNK